MERPSAAPTAREGAENRGGPEQPDFLLAGSDFRPRVVKTGRLAFDSGSRRKSQTDVSASFTREEPTMHVVGYVRVSTEEQERSGLGIDAQIEAITTECDRRGWTVEVLADLGCSGKQVNPQLRRALDLLETGQAEALVVAKLDRLARSVRHASAIIDDAVHKGWSLLVLDNALDLTTPGGRAMAQMLATFAELEREMISTRTKEALAARARRGEQNGRKSAIPAGVLRRIVISRDAGSSFARIARELTTEGVLTPTGLPSWHESTVRRAYTTATREAVPA